MTPQDSRNLTALSPTHTQGRSVCVPQHFGLHHRSLALRVHRFFRKICQRGQAAMLTSPDYNLDDPPIAHLQDAWVSDETAAFKSRPLAIMRHNNLRNLKIKHSVGRVIHLCEREEFLSRRRGHSSITCAQTRDRIAVAQQYYACCVAEGSRHHTLELWHSKRMASG